MKQAVLMYLTPGTARSVERSGSQIFGSFLGPVGVRGGWLELGIGEELGLELGMGDGEGLRLGEGLELGEWLEIGLGLGEGLKLGEGLGKLGLESGLELGESLGLGDGSGDKLGELKITEGPPDFISPTKAKKIIKNKIFIFKIKSS